MSKPTVTPVKGKIAITKSAGVYARSVASPSRSVVRIAGMDIASSCGVSFCDFDPAKEPFQATLIGGQWDLSLSTHDTQSIRYLRLLSFLDVLQPDLIMYEEVKFTGVAPSVGGKNNISAIVARAVSGAQVVHSLCAVLLTWAEQAGVPCEAVPIGTLKKYATGKGVAGKEAMIAAGNARFGTELDADSYESTGADNIMDSMFLCAMGVEKYGKQTRKAGAVNG